MSCVTAACFYIPSSIYGHKTFLHNTSKILFSESVFMIFPHVALGEFGDAAVWFLFQTRAFCNYMCSLCGGTGLEPDLSRLWFPVSQEGRVKCLILTMVLFYRKQPHVNTETAALRQNIMTTCLKVLLLKQPRPVEHRLQQTPKGVPWYLESAWAPWLLSG